MRVVISRHTHLLPLTPNAPVQARWAHAQRAGPSPPNPPTVACNRLLEGMLTLSRALINCPNRAERRNLAHKHEAKKAGTERHERSASSGNPDDYKRQASNPQQR